MTAFFAKSSTLIQTDQSEQPIYLNVGSHPGGEPLRSAHRQDQSNCIVSPAIQFIRHGAMSVAIVLPKSAVVVDDYGALVLRARRHLQSVGRSQPA